MPTQASQSISDFQGDNLSVNMFGAVGDGITDDTASCQAALDFAGPLGLSVFFPAGVYIISAALRCYTLTPTYTPYHGLALEGAGEGATTLLIKSGSVPSGTNCCNGISVSNPFDTSATNPTLRTSLSRITPPTPTRTAHIAESWRISVGMPETDLRQLPWSQVEAETLSVMS